MTAIIAHIAKILHIDPFLIMAIISVESHGISSDCSYAIHHEKGYPYVFKVKEMALYNDLPIAYEKWGQQTAWGPMQITGGNARELKFKGDFTRLCVPKIGIYYGSKILKQKLRKYKSPRLAVAAYNSGQPLYNKRGRLINHKYVEKVLRRYRRGK